MSSSTNFPQVLCVGEVLWDCFVEQVAADDHSSDSRSQQNLPSNPAISEVIDEAVNEVITDTTHELKKGSKTEKITDQSNLNADPILQIETRYLGGAPANVACGLAKLGVAAGLVSAVGDDAAGRSILDRLTAIGVNCTGVQVMAEAITRHVRVERDATGERHFVGFQAELQQTFPTIAIPLNTENTTIFESENQKNQPVTEVKQAEFADTQLSIEQIQRSAIVRADFLVTGTLSLAFEKSADVLEMLVEMAKRSLTTVIVDVNWRPIFWTEYQPEERPLSPALIALRNDGVTTELITPQVRALKFLKQADWLKFSATDARLLLDTSDPSIIAAMLPQARGIIVTDGEHGCTYHIQPIEPTAQPIIGHLPAFAVQTIDVTGAGDSFVAAWVYQLIQQGETAMQSRDRCEEILRYASAAGALTTLKVGAIEAQPSDAEIRAFLATQNE